MITFLVIESSPRSFNLRGAKDRDEPKLLLRQING